MRERELMGPQERERMHESVDRTELTPRGRAVEGHDHAGHGSLSEAHANEVSR
jgi:hypothetical protein